jgi:plastocyanin
MHDGMMGSLLVVQGGQFASTLPRGEPCHDDHDGPVSNGDLLVKVQNFQFSPKAITVTPGTKVIWEWDVGATQHSTQSDVPGKWDSGVHDAPHTFEHRFTAADAMQTFPYYCVVHGAPNGIGMSGSVTVTM